jgi:hypothetical protein
MAHLRRSRIAWGIALGVWLACAQSAGATMQNQVAYKKAYPGKEPKAYSCKVCHEGMVGKATDLNAYGLALQQFKGAGKAKALTETDYQEFDVADLDQDGASNRAELDAATKLDDPASKPTDAPKP